jgi:uncharacterized protein (DUF58 family)
VSAPRWRTTRDGRVWAVASLALLAVAVLSGNNLVYLVAAPVWVAGILALPLGHWQLRRLDVRRVLPPELVAGREVGGELLVRNGRARLAARGLEVEESAVGAVGLVALVAPGGVGSARVRYRFPERGPVALDRVIVRSQWPMGLFEHELERALPASLVVFPRPAPGVADPRAHEGIGDDPETARRGGGDFLGLRAYREGDPPRSVHWLSSARAGALVVVEREAEVGTSVRVVVADAHGAAWEQELSRAAGEVGRAFARGHGVAMVLPGGPPELDGPPRGGGGWRRSLLTALALAPVRPAERR